MEHKAKETGKVGDRMTVSIGRLSFSLLRQRGKPTIDTA